MHQQDPGLLVVEEHELRERHVLIRHRDEAGLEQPRIGAAPLADGELLVLATPGAHRVPSLVSALPELLRERLAGVESLWLGVGGLAADTEAAQRLAEELGVEIVAPDGGIVAMPGAALYAGHGAGGIGWHRFHPDGTVSFHGARLPVPEWESWAPASPVTLGDVVAVPVPCGLLIRPAAADGPVGFDAAVEIAFEIAVNQRFPKIIVTAPNVADVAEVLAGFPPHPVMVVPATPEAAKHTWQLELALRLSQDIVFSAGPQLGGSTVVPGGRYQPFPIVLRQAARGGDQKVLSVAPPPSGWERAGRLSYRFTEGDEDAQVLADVVPAGLVLRAEDGKPDPDAEAAPFDPAQWTLTLGAAGAPLGLPVLAAAEQLLAALSDDERAAVRVRMAGIPDGEAEHALDHRVADRKSAPPPGSPSSRPLSMSSPAPFAPSESDGAVPPVASSEVASSGPASAGPFGAGRGGAAPGAARPFRSPPGGAMTPAIPGVPATPVVPVVPGAMMPAVPGSFVEPGPGRMPPVAPPTTVAPPSIMTTSGAPVSTVSSGMPTSTVAGAPKPPLTPPPPPIPPTPPREEFREGPEEATIRAEPVHAEPEAAAEPVPPGPPPPPAEEPSVPPSASPVDREPDPPVSPAIRPVTVPVRNSTTGEQNRFVAAAGEDFGIALATVNAALATWPSMRAEDSPAGKADYVAVCLYLSRGEGAANLVNGALRTGEGAVLDGHVPCLMSGLRRLPTHRRAVLRQGRVAESLEHRGDPGTVLTEPGFLAASMDLDVTFPGADLDVLIWPASARRTSELMLSRPVGEAMFTAGARFKTLAVRSVSDDEQEEPEDDPDALSAPKVAVLFRELAPGEKLESADLDDRDRAVLAKLDSVLAGRRSAALRLIDDPDAIARLTTSMVLWRDEPAGEGKSVAVAS